MSHTPTWTLLARILRPQGRKGEVLAELFTDFPERFASHPDVWLAPSGFSDTGSVGNPAQPSPARITAHWLPVGRNVGRVVLHFTGVDSIAAAEQLIGKEVIIPAEARMPLAEGALYISELIGCTVYDRETALGEVHDVEFATSSDGARRLEDAAPLLIVRGAGGTEILIPFAKQYLVAVDASSKTVRMQLPEGLTEVNAPVDGPHE